MTPICSSHRERERWLEERRRYVTASEVSTIMGVNPYSSPLRLYNEKLGLAPSFEGNEATEWGSRLEPVIAEVFGERTGMPTRHASELDADFVRSDEHPFIACTVDGYCDDGEECLLEIKTAGARAMSQWDEDVPEGYRLQVQTQLLVTGLERAYIVCLLAGQRMVYADIEADPDTQAQIIAAARDFHRRLELGRRALDGEDVDIDPPDADGSRADAQALEAMAPTVDGEECVLTIEAAEAHHEIAHLQEQIKPMADRIEVLKNQIRAAMGSAETGYLPGGGAYTNRQTKRGRVLRFSEGG